MKLLFLDVDGVLNSQRWCGEKGEGWECTFDPAALRELERIVHLTCAHIVVSSAWRIGESRASMLDKLGAAGMSAFLRLRIIGLTPYLRHEAPVGGYLRGDEIRAWMNLNVPSFERRAAYGPLESFVILDDGDDMGALKPYLVQTRWEVGLTREDADRAIEILNGPTRRVA